LDNVKIIFDECGLSFIWRAQSVYGSKELLCNKTEMSLKDQFKQKWHSESPKCFNYKIFKTEHTYETFFDILPSAYLQKMINFRMCNNCLTIETNYAGLVLTEIIESVTWVIKEILETNFIIYLVVRSLLTQEEVCYLHVILKIKYCF